MLNSSQIYRNAFQIPMEYVGERLDRVLAILLPGHSRTRIQQWITAGYIQVNGAQRIAKDKVSGGETIEIDAPYEIPHPEWLSETEDTALPLNIVFADSDIIVVNKPANWVVHPAAGHHSGTLVNVLLGKYPELQNLPRAGIVHRLDKDTTGLMVVARSLTAHTRLVKQLQARTVTRIYEALVWGHLVAGNTINAPMDRHPKDRKRMALVSSGKPAITHYRVLKKFQHCTLLQVRLETGRTHQIRVHMASIQHPIVGDHMYGGRSRFPKNTTAEIRTLLNQFPRQALHAKTLALAHPTTGEILSWDAPLPIDMQDLLSTLP
jgi:23S rRNA pseudouridine1911/1915/1917 synthase